MTKTNHITDEQYRQQLEKSITDDVWDCTVRLWGFLFEYKEDDPSRLLFDPLEVCEGDVWEYLPFIAYRTGISELEVDQWLRLKEEEDIDMPADLLAVLECGVREVISDYLGMEVAL